MKKPGFRRASEVAEECGTRARRAEPATSSRVVLTCVRPVPDGVHGGPAHPEGHGG